MSPSAARLEVKEGDVLWRDTTGSRGLTRTILDALDPLTSTSVKAPIFFEVIGPIELAKSTLLGDDMVPVRRLLSGVGPDSQVVKIKAQVDCWSGVIRRKDRFPPLNDLPSLPVIVLR